MTDVSGDILTVMADASLVETQEAIPGLPNHLVVEHILVKDYFDDDDPADLARLPVVSRAMRDAVAAMGLKFIEPNEIHAAEFGWLSAVRRLGLAGHLQKKERLCQAAARSGQLAELKLLRASGCLRSRSARRTPRNAGVGARE